MKQITLLFIICCSYFICAAQIDTTGLPTVDGKIKFVNIVNIPGSNKNALFLKAQAWVSQNFKSDKNKIIVSDPINSILSGEYYNGTKESPGLKFTYTITCKDDKYRVEIENLQQFLDLSNLTGTPGSWVYIQGVYDNNYLKRKEKGKNVKMYEKQFIKVKAELNQTVIMPFNKGMATKPTDF